MSGPTPNQRRAIEVTGNILVEAGAGAGKTRTLIERCLARVFDDRDPVSLDEILMVTFTETAAAEMRQRIRGELEARLRQQPDDTRLAEQYTLLETAQISTLHSFCLHLVRDHFFELGIDPQIAILDDSESQLLAQETLEELLRHHYAGATAQAEAVQKLILEQGRGWDQPVRDLVLRLHEYTQTRPEPEEWFRSQIEQFQSSRPDFWARWLLDNLEKWRNEWAEALSGVSNHADGPAGQYLLALRDLPISATRAEAAAMLSGILAIDANWPNGRKGPLRKLLEELLEETRFLNSLAGVRDGVDPLEEDWNWIRLPILTLLELAREFAAAFAGAKREQGKVDFHDLEQFALRLLWSPKANCPTPIAEEWRRKFQFVFVDEYQDINAAQDRIIQALSRDGDEGNRFLVGDVKQSIYRFRLADPRIFQRYSRVHESGDSNAPNNSLTPSLSPSREEGARRADEGEELLSRSGVSAGRRTSYPYQTALCRDAATSPIPDFKLGPSQPAPFEHVIPLTENFRSHEMLLHFINPLFRMLMRKEIGGVPYDDRAQLRFGKPDERKAVSVANDPSPRVEVHLFLTGQGEEPDADENEAGTGLHIAELSTAEKEARLIALRLRELKNQPLKIWDDALKKRRPVEWNDMVVLLRAPSGKAESFAKEFSRLKIPLEVARTGFFEAIEVSDLLNVLTLLDNPLQDVPLLAVLRSPLVGLSVNELAQVRLAARKVRFWVALQRFHQTQRNHPCWIKVDTFLQQFRRWRSLSREASLARRLEVVLDETHYLDWLLAQPRGAQRKANALQLLALARKFDAHHGQGLYRFLRFLEAQRETAGNIEPAPLETENAVRLMSIHQSKGLEFPVVVAADLGKRFNLSELKGGIILDEEFGLCPQVKPPHIRQYYPSLPYWVARRRQKAEALGEELRILYVAFTRAKDTLILSGACPARTALEEWSRYADAPMSIHQLLKARNYLDWLGPSLTQLAETPDWAARPHGTSSLWRWRIHRDASLAEAEQIELPFETPALDFGPDSKELAQLKTRLEWRYPFELATREPAKTSVTFLRRRLTHDTAAEAQPAPFAFPPLVTTAKVAIAKRTSRQLTAAEIGIAHHRFLQFAGLETMPDETSLQREVGRLTEMRFLSNEQAKVLDIAALSRFWKSEPGKRICASAVHVHRELPFTLRFTRDDLAALGFSPLDDIAPGEFAVVQGVVDLAVVLPKEIWIVDFKTDHVDTRTLPEKLDQYGRQLKLYALALNRIYQRPVTERWLHLLATGKSVSL